ncbi:MAG: tRNA (adenosine(37)-N6)-threonylcarbamoyltransferase complex dimerization subunit type 1 TsaB [Nodosilinea sp.]
MLVDRTEYLLKPMLGLAIHTSSPALGLAISNFEEPARHQTWAFGRDLSTHLHTTLATFIQPHAWADLSFLAVARGPGSFTGTRIGVVTARTLAQQLNIPLFGVSSLAAAAQAALDHNDGPRLEPLPHVAVEMQAQRGLRFTAMYGMTTAGLAERRPEQVITPAAWETVLAQYPDPFIRIVVGAAAAETVLQVLTLTYTQWRAGERPHWSDVLPYYGQHPVDSY